MYMIYVVSYVGRAQLRNSLSSNLLDQGWGLCPTRQKTLSPSWDKSILSDGPVSVRRVPFFGLSDGNWHHVAVSVSAKHLALYVDCTRLQSVEWEYRGMENSTAGLLMVGGIIEGHETPFEVRVKCCLDHLVGVILQNTR